MATPPETPDPLADAVPAARRAFLDLFGLMAAHNLDFRQLPLLLDWPAPVRTAYDFWVARMADVINALARQSGIENPSDLSPPDKSRLTNDAYALVMN